MEYSSFSTNQCLYTRMKSYYQHSSGIGGKTAAYGVAVVTAIVALPILSVVDLLGNFVAGVYVTARSLCNRNIYPMAAATAHFRATGKAVINLVNILALLIIPLLKSSPVNTPLPAIQMKKIVVQSADLSQARAALTAAPSTKFPLAPSAVPQGTKATQDSGEKKHAVERKPELEVKENSENINKAGIRYDAALNKVFIPTEDSHHGKIEMALWEIDLSNPESCFLLKKELAHIRHRATTQKDSICNRWQELCGDNKIEKRFEIINFIQLQHDIQKLRGIFETLLAYQLEPSVRDRVISTLRELTDSSEDCFQALSVLYEKLSAYTYTQMQQAQTNDEQSKDTYIKRLESLRNLFSDGRRALEKEFTGNNTESMQGIPVPYYQFYNNAPNVIKDINESLDLLNGKKKAVTKQSLLKTHSKESEVKEDAAINLINTPQQFSLTETRYKLVEFYLDQKMRLETLQAQLKAMQEGPDKVRMERELRQIEMAQIPYAKAVWKAKKWENTEPTWKQLAELMGKSEAAVKAMWIGEKYAEVFANSVRSNIVVSVLYKGCPLAFKPSMITFEEIIHSWKMLINNNDKSASGILEGMDKDVAQTLKISASELIDCLRDIEDERFCNEQLNQLQHMNSSPNEVQVNEVIKNLEQNIKFLTKPGHVTKLQKLLNALNLGNKHPVYKQIKSLLEKVMQNMSLQRQRSLVKTLNSTPGMGISQTVASDALQQPFLPSQIEYVNDKEDVLVIKREYVKMQALKILNRLQEAYGKEKIETWDPASDQVKAIQTLLPLSYLPYFNKLGKSLKSLDKAVHALAEYLLSSHEARDIEVTNRYLEGQVNESVEKLASVYNKELVIKWDINSAAVKAVQQAILPPFLEFFNAIGETTDSLNAAVELYVAKLHHMQERYMRNAERIEFNRSQPEAANPNSIIIPEYFHATTSMEAALSIAHSEIEVLQASSGLGAFVSRIPESRYGDVYFGLPKEIEFSSETETFLASGFGSVIQDNTVWPGFKNGIAIDPKIARIKDDFLVTMSHLISFKLRKFNLSDEERILLEAKLINQFQKTVVFRYCTLSNGQKGWKMHYRPYFSRLNEVHGLAEMVEWTKLTLESALKIYHDEHKKNLSDEMKKVLEEFPKTFSESFQEAFQQNKKWGEATAVPFAVPQGKSAEPILASIIASDNDPVIAEINRNKWLKNAKNLPVTQQMKKELREAVENQLEQFFCSGLNQDLKKFVIEDVLPNLSVKYTKEKPSLAPSDNNCHALTSLLCGNSTVTQPEKPTKYWDIIFRVPFRNIEFRINSSDTYHEWTKGIIEQILSYRGSNMDRAGQIVKDELEKFRHILLKFEESFMRIYDKYKMYDGSDIFKTINVVQQKFNDSAIQVTEFIPLSEVQMERYLLDQAGACFPKLWPYKKSNW